MSQVYVHDGEWDNVDVSTYLLGWDNSTSSVKGYIIVKSNTNNDNTFAIFQLNSLNDGGSYVQFNVSYVAGNIPTNGEACVIEFYRTGDSGSGTSGTSGANGNNGNNGNNGTSGTSGANGNNGNNGNNGTSGTSGNSASVTTTNVAFAIEALPLCSSCAGGDYVRWCSGDTSNGYNGMCFGA